MRIAIPRDATLDLHFGKSRKLYTQDLVSGCHNRSSGWNGWWRALSGYLNRMNTHIWMAFWPSIFQVEMLHLWTKKNSPCGGSEIGKDANPIQSSRKSEFPASPLRDEELSVSLQHIRRIGGTCIQPKPSPLVMFSVRQMTLGGSFREL
jgi:hypothetical protein